MSIHNEEDDQDDLLHYGNILIDLYDHTDTYDFWCVMVEFGEQLVEWSQTKKNFMITFPIYRNENALSYHKISMLIIKDLELEFNIGKNGKEYHVGEGEYYKKAMKSFL